MIFRARKTYRNGIDYDKDTNYTEKMQLAKQAGDTELLAKLEEERNRKIDGEKMNERKTYDYIDIGTKIEAGIRDGASPSEIKELTEARRDKATQNEQYDSYKNDEIQKKGLKYYYDNESGAGYGYQNRPDYKNSYEDDIRSLINEINSAKEFEYDPNDDEVYKNLKSQMENESRRAATDVLADIQAQSGGRSSYAVSAAMQAANNFNAKLAEELPKLYEIAYKRYNDQKESDRQALDSTLKAAGKEYDEYLDEMEQFNADREFARDSYEAALDRMSEEDERKAEEKRDERDFDYKVFQDSQEAEQNAMKMAKELVIHYEESGIPAPAELLALAGMESYGDLNKQSADYNSYMNNLAAAVKNRQIANYDARTSKAYSDMSNNSAKLNLQNEKYKLDLKKYEDEHGPIQKVSDGSTDENVTNRKSENGYYIGNQFFSIEKLETGLASGSIVKKKNADGTVTFEKK